MPEYTPDQFAAILVGAIPKAAKATVDVVRKSSGNVKIGARKNVQMTAPIHNAHAQFDINYDVDTQGTWVVGDIGYDTGPGKSGNLGNLLEHGGGGDHSPPHRDLGRAMDVEEPRFIQALEDLTEQVIE